MTAFSSDAMSEAEYFSCPRTQEFGMFRKLFLDHPAEVDESYGEHFGVAASFGVTMIMGGLCALIHAFIPRFFKTKGSETVLKLHKRLIASRGAHRDAKTIEWNI
jgi:Family of unknown function (DUF6356)